MLKRWLNGWWRWHERQRRGRLIEQAVHRVGGDLALVDHTLTQLAHAWPRPKLCLRSQGRSGKQLGLFLPLWEREPTAVVPPLPDIYQPATVSPEDSNGRHTHH